jgi:DNA-binding transcriptional MerR regulator
MTASTRIDDLLDEFWLTRIEAAKVLGVSKTRVRQFEAAGVLCPLRDHRGRWRFNPEEILDLATRRGAAGASGRGVECLVAMFRARRSVLEIRAATGLSTEKIMRLYAEYRTPVDRQYERHAEELEARALLDHERRLRDLARRTRTPIRDEFGDDE